MIIGKKLFGCDDFNFGIELCLKKAGRTAFDVSAQTASSCDVILISMFWFYDVYYLEKFLRDSGIKSRDKKPIIIAGGIQATISPQIIAEMVDYVFIGDADDHLKKILDDIEKGKNPESKYLYKKGDDIIPEPAECDPTAFFIKKNDKQRTVYRIEIARGCKFKCKFCMLSSLKSYREVSADEIIDQLKQIPKGSIVSPFAPERTFHSEYKKISEAINRFGLINTAADLRLESLHKTDRNLANVGIEGLSYKLRKSIGKNFTDEFILEKMDAFYAQISAKSPTAILTFYFIADLPGENENDWEACYNLFEKIEKLKWSHKLWLRPVLNPLSPKKFTAMVDAEIHPFVDYKSKWLNLIRKNNEHWKFKVNESSVWSPWMRIIDALVQRGGSEAYNVIKTMPTKYLTNYPKPSESILFSKQLIKKCVDLGISENKLFSPTKEV